MKLEMITEGLKNLLLENRYNPSTIRFYEREWKKIHAFLINEYVSASGLISLPKGLVKSRPDMRHISIRITN